MFKVITVISLCLVAGLTAHPDYSDSWEDFKAKYSKEYQTDEEEVYRAGVWGTTLDLIKAHNAEAAAGIHTFTLGENKMADWTTEEITTYYNGLRHNQHGSGTKAVFNSKITMDKLPASMDWRDKNVVTDVKDQKQCGSCWAFSTTGSLEAATALKSGKAPLSLSEQNLVDCAQKEGNHGCKGGSMDGGFKYVKDNGGIDTEESYPYTAKDGKECLYNASNSGATLQSWKDLPMGSEPDLQKAVATVGPISVGIDASHPKFHFYKEGTYYDPSCSSTMLDHGVLVVGYGTDSTANHKAKDYWIVKNSWGATWGQEGYIHMARNKKNNCGIASAATYPVV